MSTITIEPASPARFADVQHALSGGGDGASCQCQWWLMTGTEFDRTSRTEKQERLHAELGTTPTPALIAYVDGAAAGWVRVKQGLNARLLHAAIEHARSHGARVLDAYPTDTRGAKIPTNGLYIGILSVFQAAGIREVARPKPHRVIVQLELTDA